MSKNILMAFQIFPTDALVDWLTTFSTLSTYWWILNIIYQLGNNWVILSWYQQINRHETAIISGFYRKYQTCSLCHLRITYPSCWNTRVVLVFIVVLKQAQKYNTNTKVQGDSVEVEPVWKNLFQVVDNAHCYLPHRQLLQ